MQKKVVITLGIFLMILGNLGFVANPIFGEGSYIPSSVFYNITYIILGIVISVAGFFLPLLTLNLFGLFFLTFAIYEFNWGPFINSNFLLIDSRISWLHFLIGLTFLFFGFGILPSYKNILKGGDI